MSATTTRARTAVAVEDVRVSACRFPSDRPESDGTLTWTETTVVLVEVHGGGCIGLGYTYASPVAARLVETTLAPLVVDRDAMAVAGTWQVLVEAVRNVGRPGIASMAIAAVDVALWDLKARLLGLRLCDLLGSVRDTVPVYGSGGFTSYDPARLEAQLGGWVAQGIGRVKMKVGRDPRADPERVRVARAAIGDEAELMVDANGAYTVPTALHAAAAFAEHDVRWLEEPVSSDDLAGLRDVRSRLPAGMAVAAGEYGFDPGGLRRLIDARAVDVLQADVTRCAGLTGLLGAAALCSASGVPLSTHTAPALHADAACALAPVVHVEWFHDHVRIERTLFDGALEPEDGELRPDRSRPGHGLALRREEAERHAV